MRVVETVPGTSSTAAAAAAAAQQQQQQQVRTVCVFSSLPSPTMSRLESKRVFLHNWLGDVRTAAGKWLPYLM